MGKTLLQLARDFNVKEMGWGFIVESKQYNIEAHIKEDGLVEYFLSGCYNSSDDYMEIDVVELNKLIQFCKLLTTEV